MDELIRAALSEKAGEIDVPAGAWKQVSEEIRPALRQGFFRRVGARLEVFAAVASVLLLFWVVGALRPAGYQGMMGSGVLPPGLTVTEHRVADDREVAGDLEQLADKTMVRDTEGGPDLETANHLLKPFGYRLEHAVSGGTYALWHGDEVVLTGFTFFRPISISERQDDFIFLAVEHGERHYLVRTGSVQEWDYSEASFHRYQPPVYAGNDLVEVRWDDQLARFAVTRGGQRIFTVPHGETGGGIKVDLSSWSGHWVLEDFKDIYIDGKSLRKEQGYDEVFEWRLVNNRPLYFFKKGSQVGINYDGKVLPYRYEQVLHDMCCAVGMLNPEGNGHKFGFYALRRGVWYWVVLGATTEES